MRRWAAGFLIVLISCVPIFLARESGPQLLSDTDTRVLLAKLEERSAPLSWFAGDWPLENGFYRPVSTLVFEADRALYGSRSAGYGLTNALLCIASVLALFWFLRELTDQPAWATAGAALFAIWNVGAGWLISAPVAWGSWLLLLVPLVPGRRFWPPVLAFIGTRFLASELAGIRDLEHKVLDWIPGRTASTMTVFCLIALAAYCRYERLSARVESSPPSPLEPPPTKGSAPRRSAGGAIVWAVAAVAAAALSLASYEQAVMLPPALLGTAIYLRLIGVRVRWGWHLLFWALLIAYLGLRSALIGWDASGYQEQQFRSGAIGTVYAIMDYALPAFGPVYSYLPVLDGGMLLLLTAQPYQVALTLASNVCAVIVSLKLWKPVFLGWGLSLLAFLPMAWLNPSDFNHYHYWPMAMRALFVVAFAVALGKAIVIAVSPPAIQAPPRLRPAPGSLPRP